MIETAVGVAAGLLIAGFYASLLLGAANRRAETEAKAAAYWQQAASMWRGKFEALEQRAKPFLERPPKDGKGRFVKRPQERL